MWPRMCRLILVAALFVASLSVSGCGNDKDEDDHESLQEKANPCATLGKSGGTACEQCIKDGGTDGQCRVLGEAEDKRDTEDGDAKDKKDTDAGDAKDTGGAAFVELHAPTAHRDSASGALATLSRGRSLQRVSAHRAQKIGSHRGRGSDRGNLGHAAAGGGAGAKAARRARGSTGRRGTVVVNVLPSRLRRRRPRSRMS